MLVQNLAIVPSQIYSISIYFLDMILDIFLAAEAMLIPPNKHRLPINRYLNFSSDKSNATLAPNRPPPKAPTATHAVVVLGMTLILEPADIKIAGINATTAVP